MKPSEKATIEDAYERGRRQAAVERLHEALQALGYAGVDAAAWALEREAAIATLRRVCAEHGDNRWPSGLHLADVIEKHLEPYLGDGWSSFDDRPVIP